MGRRFRDRAEAGWLLADRLTPYADRADVLVLALRPLVDALVWVLAPESFDALGRWYGHFAPTTDAEVCALLERGARAPGSCLLPSADNGYA